MYTKTGGDGGCSHMGMMGYLSASTTFLGSLLSVVQTVPLRFQSFR